MTTEQLKTVDNALVTPPLHCPTGHRYDIYIFNSLQFRCFLLSSLKSCLDYLHNAPNKKTHIKHERSSVYFSEEMVEDCEIGRLSIISLK